MDELHELVLGHLKLSGASDDLICLYRKELGAGLRSAENSLLAQIFRYVKNGLVQVSILGLGGELCKVLAASVTTVRRLKQEIEGKSGIAANHQSLLHGSQVLDDSETLGAYNVTPLCPLLRLVYLQASKLSVVGGSDETAEAVSCAEIFNPAVGSWAPLPPLSKRRKLVAAVYLHGKVLILGGEDENELVLDSVECFDPGLGAWTIMPSMSGRRAASAAAAWGEKLYVVGGHNEDDEVISTGEVFDPAVKPPSDLFALAVTVWNALPLMGTGREQLAVAELDSKLFALGGYDTNAHVLASGEVLDLTTGRWQVIPAMLEARAAFAAGVAGVGLCVAGGYDEDRRALASCEVFDPAACAWFALPPMGKARAALAGTALNDRLYVFGGCNGVGGVLASAEALDLDSRRWLPLPSMAVRRSSCAVAVTG